MAIMKIVPLHEESEHQQQIRDLQNQILELQYKLKVIIEYKSCGHYIKAGKMAKFVHSSVVVMIEALSNYTNIYLADGTKLFTSKTIKHWENLFDTSSWIRIHKSYLVNRDHIDTVCKSTSTIYMKGGLHATYSRRSKELVFS